MRRKMNCIVLGLCFLVSGVTTVRGETLLSDSFSGTNGAEITTLGWVKEGGNASDKLAVDSGWPIDGGGQTGKGDLMQNGVWLTYSKSLPVAYTLGEMDVVTATISIRDGKYSGNKFAILGDTNTYTISRTLGDQPSNCYNCVNSQNVSFGTLSVVPTWWQLFDQVSYYKIVATRYGVQFFFKDVNHSTWTFLGLSTSGINTFTGVQIGGMANTGPWGFVSFDSLNVEVGPAGRGTLMSENFAGTDGKEITSIGWARNEGNAGDKLLVDSTWAIDNGGQNAKGDLNRNGVWLMYSKPFMTHVLRDSDVVTATIAFRDGMYTGNKFALLADTSNYTISRTLGDQPTNCYDCFNSQNVSFGTLSVVPTWWQLYDKVGYYKIVASPNAVQFYLKDVNHADWTLLGTSSTGVNRVSGIQIGGMANPGNWGFVSFDFLNVEVSMKAAEAPVFTRVVDNITPGKNIISGPTAIEITSVTAGANIYYTTNGDPPTAGNTRYTEPVIVNGGTTLKAIAVAEDFGDSAVTSETYTIPVLNEPQAIPSGSVAVDGNLTDWVGAAWTPLTVDTDAPTDIASAAYAVKWSEQKVYVAVKVHDTAPFLSDGYIDWNGSDSVEFYIHTNGTGDAAYPNCEIAQQYIVGITNSNTNNVWKMLGNASMYPEYMMVAPAGANFTAAGKKDGDWLYYEVAMTPYKFCGVVAGQSNIVSPLKVGDLIGLDVCVIAHGDSAYTGVKSENNKGQKSSNMNQFGMHKLVADTPKTPGDANGDKMVDVGDLGILAANYGGFDKTWAQGDFNGDMLVDVGDLGILAAHYGENSTNQANFSDDYAKAFGATVAENAEDTTVGNSACSALGLPLIAGVVLMGLMLVKLEE